MKERQSVFSRLAAQFFECDMVGAPHGRAPAVATGIKRALPDSVVFTYQGDGDLAAIGTCETVHAAARGENITVIFVNNTIYGMTGGQMAPTTLPGQVTQTTPYGREPEIQGYPVKVCEMLATIDGTALAQRVSVDTPTNWGLTPVDALQRLRDEMIPYFPLGVYKDEAVWNKEEKAD